MDVEIQAALIGGALAGLVVLLGVLLEQRLTRGREHRSRRQQLIGSILGEYIYAIATNVRAGAIQDMALINSSEARIASAHCQLLVFGSPGIAQALEDFSHSGKNLGVPADQTALLHLLQAIRDEVLPREPEIQQPSARDLLFGGV